MILTMRPMSSAAVVAVGAVAGVGCGAVAEAVD